MKPLNFKSVVFFQAHQHFEISFFAIITVAKRFLIAEAHLSLLNQIFNSANSYYD